MEPSRLEAIWKALEYCVLDDLYSFYITVTILNHYHDKWFKDDKGRDMEGLSNAELQLRTQIRCAIVHGEAAVESDDWDKAHIIGAMRGYLHNALDLIREIEPKKPKQSKGGLQ